MTFTVTIRLVPKPLSVAPGETLLAAALARGIPYPHGCRSGVCGVCRTRLIAGEVAMAAHAEGALSAAERAQGLILACRATPRTDCTVAWLDLDDAARHPQRVLACRVAGIEDATHDIRIVRLGPVCGPGSAEGSAEASDRFEFSAGQYASVSFEGQPPRDYSMANRPDEPGLEFHIRHVADGGASAHVARALGPGDKVTVAGPLGRCFLRRRHRGPIVAVAGGSGLAPMKSIVETALGLRMGQPIHLYLGVRDEPDVYLEEHFLRLARRHPNLTFTPVLSEPTAPTGRRTGPVADAIARDLGHLDGCTGYLAGPPAMVEAARRALEGLGMRAEDIHADPFYSAAEQAALDRGQMTEDR